MIAKNRCLAVSYLRVSSRSQVDGDGFDRQREAVNQYAGAEGIEIVEEFRDGVCGATDLDERPGLGALLDRVEANGVRLVLIERADRLARDLLVGEIILSDFRKHGVRVVAADGGVDTAEENPNAPDAATRTLVRQVLGAVAQYDRSVTTFKLRAARQRMKRRTGRCEGRKPYGARPGEATIVARMRTLRDQGASYRKIARALDAEGLPPRSGRPWCGSTIRRILNRAAG